MALSEQTKAELERRGWSANSSACWTGRTIIEGGQAHGVLSEILEGAAILGIAPPGYRLVPEEVIAASRAALEFAIRDACAHVARAADEDEREGWDQHSGVLQLLANALSSKEGENGR